MPATRRSAAVFPCLLLTLGVLAFSPSDAQAAMDINAGGSSWNVGAGDSATIKVSGATPGNTVSIAICGGTPVKVRQVKSGTVDNNGDVTITMGPRAPQIFAEGDKISVVESAPPPGPVVARAKGQLINGGAVQSQGPCLGECDACFLPTVTPTVLVLEGDTVPGVGLVTTIDDLAINSSGHWIVQVDTNGDASSDSLLLRDGALYLRENQALASPAGATISSFDSVNLNAAGHSGWNFFLDGPGTNADSGIYRDTTLLIQESNISTAPELSPNTPFIGYFDAKINDLDRIAVVASVDDPVIASTVDRALVILTLDPGGTTVVSERAFAKEGQVLPGQTEAIVDFGTAPHESAFSNQGEMFYFADLAGATTTDGVLYLGLTKIAQEGVASPIAGRNYEILSGRGLDVNNLGEVVFKANIDGNTANDEMIVVEGKELIREGSTLPNVSPFLFTALGLTSGPVGIDDDRNVLWFGDWDNPDLTKDTGLFINDVLIVSEGTPVEGGVAIASFANGQDAFFLSDNGRYVIAEVVLTDTNQAALRFEIHGPPPVPDSAKVPGSMMLATKNGADIDVTWDVTSCLGTGYNLFYGDLATLSTYAYTGAACSLGVTGQASFTPPSGNLFFIIASEDALGIESGHGYDSRGRARPANAGGRCGVRSQIRSALCPGE